MELFKELTQLHGVSGYEREVRAFIKERVQDYADEVIEDAIGDLIVFKKGTGAHKKKMMLCAHMDEIGLQVIKIEQDGRIMVKSMGCSWMYTTYQSRVRFRNGTIGIVASRVRPEDLNGQFTNLYVDIGVASKEEVLKYVDVGDVAIYEGPYEELAGDFVSAKAIVLIVVVVIVIIAVVVFLLMRTGRTAKAVGGVKGKKTAKKAAPKKTNTKAVKVWCVYLKGIIEIVGMRGVHCSPDREVNWDGCVKRE